MKDKVKKYLLSMGLQKKFIISISASSLILGLLASLVVYFTMADSLTHELHNTGLSITRNLAANAVDPILTQNIMGLQQLISNIKDIESDVAYAYIINQKGNVLAHTFNASFPIGLKRINLPVSGDLYSAKLLDTDEGYIRDFAVSLFRDLGTAHIGISENRIRQTITKTIWTLITMSFIVIGFGTLLAFFIAKRVLEPLNLLTRGAEKITSGDLEYRITVYTKDEVGLLALAFNKMVEELQKSIIRLKQEIDERKKVEKVLAEQLRLEALGSSIGVALASESSLQEMLQLCSEEFVLHIGVAFARIWIMDQDNDELVLQASAGMYTHRDGAHSRIPVGSMKIGHIALTREPHLTNEVLSDPQISNQEWARKEGMVAFAGYPLVIDDRVIGVMAMFSREVLTDSALRLLESVAVRIAIGIERKKAERALAESEERYKNLFQNSRAVMLLFDPKTAAIIDANPAALKFYGYSYEQFLNMKISDVNTLSSEKITEEMEKAKKDERNYFVFPHRLSSGKVKSVEVYSGPVVMKGRQLLFSIIHDISKRVIVERERENLTKELEQIVHATSHDLRSPMLNVHGYSHIMSESVEKCRSLIHRNDVPEDIQSKLEGILEEHIVEPARYIDKSIKQMDSMLSGLLKLSRSGRVELNIEDLDMNQLLRDVMVNFELQIKEKGIKLHLSELPPCRGDEGQIGQVFLNLIGNAIKYLIPGRPGIIHISGKKKEGMATYCVEDNGSGIAPEDRDRIFTIFQQVDRSFGGEGLGLTIVKKTIERHGGRIWVESEIGKWTKFSLALPAYENE